jgi:hypothetical protein
MVNRDDNVLSLAGYWQLGEQFLILAEGACRELVRSDNAWVVVTTDRPLTDDQYHEATKWSDFNIGVPVLFNLYHGVELLLKGFIALSGPPSTGHSLTNLLTRFESSYSDSAFGQRVRQLVLEVDSASPFGRFLAENELRIDQWYQALKYPESLAGQRFSHGPLRYGSDEAVGFWKACGETAKGLRLDSVHLLRTVEHV